METLESKYTISKNGTAYNSKTAPEVMDILDRYLQNRKRLILDYGNTETGKSWEEVFDIRGTVGRSTGTIKIPLLIKTSRSYGGGGILDHCIVKIIDSETKAVLYQHPKYNTVKTDKL